MLRKRAGRSATSGGPAGGAGAGTSAGGVAGAPGNVSIVELRGREGCLPRGLPVVETAGDGVEVGQVRCHITEVRAPGAGAACACDMSQNLVAAPSNIVDKIRTNAESSGICGGASSVSCATLCACDLLQSTGAALTECQTDATLSIAEMPPGFCYVDVTLTPPLGNAALVATCPASSRRELRILGPVGQPAPFLFLSCVSSTL